MEWLDWVLSSNEQSLDEKTDDQKDTVARQITAFLTGAADNIRNDGERYFYGGVAFLQCSCECR